MNELLRRLFLKPWLAGEIFIATFFINLLFLASPIYVIQILSRYIPYGFDGTLVTLTTGMVVAMTLLFAFTVIRNRLSAAVSLEPDQELSLRSLAILARGRSQALLSISQNVLHEVMSLPQAIQPAFDAIRINTVVDMPFCLLFLLATMILSPLLALITFFSILCSVLASWMSMNKARDAAMALQQEVVAHRGLVASAVVGAETVRAFRGGDFLRRTWDVQMNRLAFLRKSSSDQRDLSQGVLQGIGGVLRVGIYAVGAKLVVNGDMSVGALIGASILASKALQISSSYMQTCHMLAKAQRELSRLNEFFSLPLENQTGTALREYTGRVSLKDLSFVYPGATGPLFESFNLELEPGSIASVLGFNGAGKSTLCKLAVGLMDPSRGHVLIDGINMRQLAPDWWRQQVSYLPQEPTFLTATMRENIILAAPDIDGAKLNEVVRASGLRRFLDASKNGLETVLVEGGRNLPLGVRKRLALARALAVGGKLAVLDEPTEGLDAEGCAAVYGVMNNMAKQGTTIIVVTQDSNILKGVSVVIDLTQKPVPKIDRNPQVTPQQDRDKS